jgi:hypothetical protein
MQYTCERIIGQTRALALGATVLGALALAAGVHATPTPSSGTITPSTTTPLTWTGGNISGANADESTCQENITCESFVLTVTAGDYTGKQLTLRLDWLSAAADYDMYVHDGSLSGPLVTSSAQGTTNFEQAFLSFNPPVMPSTKTYYVHVVAFAVPAGINYTGTITLTNTPPPRVATYVPTPIHFSPNITLTAPVTPSDGEPSIRVDVRGNCYVGGIEGVPAGVDMWRFDLNQTSPTFDPGLQNTTYLGKPDAFFSSDPNDTTAGGADGGGDIDLSVGFPTSPDSIPVLTITSLSAANISSAVSYDRGVTFQKHLATALAPADDRQWNESDGPNTVYMMYRAPVPATGLFLAKSTDHGGTFPTTSLVSPTGTTPGYIDVDHATGTIYIAHSNSSSCFVSRSNDGGATWDESTVDNSTQHGTLFDVVKVGRDGTVYVAWSDGFNIFLAHSANHGVTWSDKVRVSDNSVYKTNLFPWIAAGDAGRVDIVWYGTTSPTNTDAADWVVRFAQSTNATNASPTFAEGTISDHVIHGSNISTGGLTGSANRNLLDYFQIALDPQGAAVLAYTDDHNDFNGNVYVTRQLDGTSLYANANGTGQVNPVTITPPPPPDPNAPQVVDFLHDAVTGLLQTIPTDSPFDILSVRYGCARDSVTQGYQLVTTMAVSSLSPIPAAMNWRMNFTANAPGGVSDRGDQFWVKANSDNPAALAYTYGTAVRNSDGSLTYTSRGTADFGAVDTVAKTITIKIALSRLNQYVTHGPAIGPGSVLYGLRGSTFTDGANGARDLTRGGTSYLFTCGVTSVAEDRGVTGRTALGVPLPSPTSGRATVHFTLARTGFAELSVFDMNGRRVRTLEARTMAPGEHTAVWDGRTDRFRDAAPGVYVLALHTAEGIQTQRIALIR